jgi:hypothetical protein
MAVKHGKYAEDSTTLVTMTTVDEHSMTLVTTVATAFT